ncbi:MAG: sugar phosphate isomerase/epimerase [bacterium]|nr:sugar phosphate isomerase/epimerase [bacterium]
MTQPGIPNELVLSTSCYGPRLRKIEDQAFSAVAMGFRRLELGLNDHPVDLHGWEDSTRETGIRVDSIVVGTLNPRSENMSGSLLGSSDPESRERALNSTRRHIRLAQQLKAPVVVVRGCAVEDPRLATEAAELTALLEDACDDDIEKVQEKIRAFVHKVQKRGHKQLEHFCRSLHTLRREFPETRMAVEPGLLFNDLLNFEAMQWTLDDLANQAVGYWHDTGRIHQRGIAGLPNQGDWLDTFAGRMFGVHLQDATHEEAELPPGQGEVDFKLVAEYTPTEAARVVEVNPRHGRAEVLASVQFLVDRKF